MPVAHLQHLCGQEAALVLNLHGVCGECDSRCLKEIMLCELGLA
jgi:hypothetical protein